MQAIVSILSSLLLLYTLVLLVRVVLDFVTLFSRSWRPSGPVLVLANAVYGLTDPPLRLIRSRIPALGFGGFGIDLSFLVLWFAIVLLRSLLGLLA
ncbi:YggT family protein [Actinomyces trachealis]|uniref:YggT family protein n=1 Tax=Actinomyces trachealis TaxID=2763540 RepID=UPI001FD23FF0|nr:YggT family protein [Actinomyces trachealis]